ncbi:DUF3791 domain-containing protein [Bacteroides sp. 51]|uniref:DUF3791 domain-containing protein n=1 Tax=Bacteroides sp. 51 TaxID=2302938 RepID=UPI0013D6FF9E|nr:DUF3791 domain-containing protein [Bacteroides sp. 51]NDV82025.1 DUF3791 domain-containing protein [Bacteroides sp. 51]
MDNKLDNKITYINYCINAFADKYELSSKEAYSYLRRFKGLEFLDKCYEAEHLLSIRDAVKDLVTICKSNGGEIG